MPYKQQVISRALAVLGLFLASVGGAAQHADLVIENVLILTMDEKVTVHENGVIAVVDDSIAAVGDASLRAHWEAKRVIDAGGDIAMPGMINLHNHIPMVAFRGLGENGIDNRLFKYFFPLERDLLSRELIYTAARHAAIELALSGVTLVTDMYYHEDEVARAVAEVGIRGVLGETVIGFPVVDASEPYGGLEYAEKFVRQWKGHPLITPAVAPHALYTVSPEWLLKSRKLAEREGVPILIHLAEFANEPDLIRERINDFPASQSVVEYLDEMGFLSDSLLAAHTIYVDRSDMQILKRHGVGVSHNPKANSRANSGRSPAWDMFKLGLDIGLGTDGPMSSNQMDILNVMNHTAGVARFLGQDSTRFTPFELVYLATMGGARSLDMEDKIGSLEIGKKADIIIVDVHAPNMQPNYDVYATLAFAAYPENVRTTIVNGRVIVEDGVLQQVDIDSHMQAWNVLTNRVAAYAKTLE